MEADVYFSKKPFVDRVQESGLHFINRLRDDSMLMYMYSGKPTGKKGRPKKYGDKIMVNELDTKYFDKVVCNKDLTVYSALVYSMAFQRDIKLAVAVFYKDGQEVARKLFFSTNLQQEGTQIVCYYRLRFQIEFVS